MSIDLEEFKKFLDNMSEEDMWELLEEAGYFRTDTCQPDTCFGQCQGAGSCADAKAWRGELDDNLQES